MRIAAPGPTGLARPTRLSARGPFAAILQAGIAVAIVGLRSATAGAHAYYEAGGLVRRLAHLTLAVSLLFLLAPELDLAVSALFAGTAGGFPLTGDEGLRALREVAKWLTIGIVSAFAVSLVVQALGHRSTFVLRPHKALFGLTVYALGPLLLVNLVLKESFGRARPREIAEFGGMLDFSPVWQMADACLSNCSFTSGEAASAAAMLSLAFLVPRMWRFMALVLIAVPAVVFSASRIALGGHFLSDVLLSWLLVGLVIALIRPLFFGRLAPLIDRAVIGSGPGMRKVANRAGRLADTARTSMAAARPEAGASRPHRRAKFAADGAGTVSRTALLL